MYSATTTIQRKCRRSILHSVCLSFLCLALLCAFTAGSGIAEDPAAPNEAAENLDAILMLDASGSMLITDPQRLRNQGAKFFAHLLKEGDRLGIVEFSEGTKVIRPLSSFDPKQVESVDKDIDKVGQSGTYTDILAAVNKAKEIFETNFRENASQVVILLSDGKFEPNPKEGPVQGLTQRLLEHIVPEVRGLGVKFYTLAFSEHADRELLKEIAAGTGGVNWYAKTPEEIHSSYADLFLVVKKPQLVPLTKAGFQIDEDISEATFYINKQGTASVSLIAPEGRVVSQETPDQNVKWFTGQDFDVVTVRDPEPGNWQVSGISAPDGYATVLTNLKLVTDWPPSVSAAEKTLLQVRLYDSQKPILLPEMAQVVQYSFFVTPTDRIAEPVARGQLYDDGTHGDKIAGDGVFSSDIIIEQVGEYKLRVIARGPTFERNQQMPFRAKPPFVALSVYHKKAESQALRTIMEMEEQKRAGSQVKTPKKSDDPNEFKDRDIIRVQLSDDAKGFKTISVNLIVSDSEKREMILPMRSLRGNPLVYEIDEFAFSTPGKYEIKAVVLASGQKGRTAQEMTQPIEFEKKKREGEEEGEGKLVLVEEKKAPAAPSNAIPIVIMSFLNCIAGTLAFLLLRKVQSGSAETLPSFTPLSVFSGNLDSLRRRSQNVSINLDDPRFAGAAPLAAVEEIADTSNEGEPVTAETNAGMETEPGAEPNLADQTEAGEDAAAAADVVVDAADIDADLSEILNIKSEDDESKDPGATGNTNEGNE